MMNRFSKAMTWSWIQKRITAALSMNAKTQMQGRSPQAMRHAGKNPKTRKRTPSKNMILRTVNLPEHSEMKVLISTTLETHG
jgi:hypothetical protein